MKSIILVTISLISVLSQSDLRPKQKKFTSQIIEQVIANISGQITDNKLKYTFINSFPNTLDTTVDYFGVDDKGNADAFVITGDIEAMWLRDSTNQLWTYIKYISQDKNLQMLTKGLIRRQISQVLQDPYANAFNYVPQKSSWYSDNTTRSFLGINTQAMSMMLHERKFETDSLSAVLRLAVGYHEQVEDVTIFNFDYMKAFKRILIAFQGMQADHSEWKSSGKYPYTFQRSGSRKTDTVINGIGLETKRTGMLRTFFRASDDSTVYQYNIPENALASSVLNQTSNLLLKAKLPWIIKFVGQPLIEKASLMATEIKEAIYNYGIQNDHFVYEVNGLGQQEFMDDSNQPSLLSLPIYGFISKTDPLYISTRQLVLSSKNIYYFKGSAASGVGGPHVGMDYIWPMAIVTQAMTSTNKSEIQECIRMLVTTTGNKWFMHESFQKDRPAAFTRDWFAWANGLFGELITMVEQEYPDLLKLNY